MNLALRKNWLAQIGMPWEAILFYHALREMLGGGGKKFSAVCPQIDMCSG